MKIGIVGLGWLGLPLAKQLLHAGHEVIASNRSGQTTLYHQRFTCFKYDPEQKKNSELEQFNTCDAVILAIPPRRESIKTYASDCVKAISYVTPQCKVILISSTSVYPNESDTYDEDRITDDMRMHSPIGYAEHALSSLLGERLTIIRFAGLVGPNRYPVIAMAKSEKIYVGNEPVNLIHLEDALGVIRFVLDGNHWNLVLNGVCNEHPTKKKCYLRMAACLNTKAPLFQDASSVVVVNRIISNNRLTQLGYRFIYPDPMDFPIG